MKIAVIGADGQLGSDLLQALRGDDLCPLYYPEFDITKAEIVRSVLRGLAPEVVINTAAYHMVDKCEDHPKKTLLVNSIAVSDLALVCRELDAILVHFSSDYVFDGAKRSPYTEEDPPNPLSVYGFSRLAGEFFVRQTVQRYFLIRTCGLYGVAGCREKGTNFVERMVGHREAGTRPKVVNDQWVTPTSTEELAQRIHDLIRTPHFGLYHLTNEGECTWFDFAREIFSLLGRDPALVIPIDSRARGAKARRPPYSVLENKRAKEIGLAQFSPWSLALKNYLLKRGLVKRSPAP